MINHEKFQQLCTESASVWGESYAILERLLRSRDAAVGVEIGVAYGGNASNLLRDKNIKTLYGVDPYSHRDNVTDTMNFTQEDFDDICRHTLKRLEKFGNRFKFIRMPSVEAVAHVPTDIDFIYIDGEHSYQGVLRDLCAWFGRVKDGGILVGDDYGHPDLPGVKKAVDEFFRRFGWTVNVERRVWWVEKQSLNISFFVPTYNYGKSIRAAISSIMDGNFSAGDELIIVNDGSTDDTAQHLLELQSEYPEIQVITHTRNRGPSATRNDAVEHCRNPILFSHDHDNILVPGSIARLKDFLITGGADVAAFGELHFFMTNTHTITHKWTFKDTPYTLADCLSDTHVPGSSGNYMFTKESWLRAGGYPDSWLDSWGLGIRQAATGSKMVALPGTFYFHQHHHAHGYESTYLKGERTGRISSLTALQILIPFLHLLDRRSANYVMSERGRNVWFKRLREHPLHVRFGTLEEYERYQIMSRYELPLIRFITKGITWSRGVLRKVPGIRALVVYVRKVVRSTLHY